MADITSWSDRLKDWGKKDSAASLDFGKFMNSGWGQAANNVMDIGDSVLGYFNEKRALLKLKEELLEEHEFLESSNKSISARASALKTASMFDRPGSTALATAMSSLLNLPEYSGNNVAPTYRMASAINSISSGVMSGIGGLSKISSDAKAKKAANAAALANAGVTSTQMGAEAAGEADQLETKTGKDAVTTAGSAPDNIRDMSTYELRRKQLGLSARRGAKLRPKYGNGDKFLKSGWGEVAEGVTGVAKGITDYALGTKLDKEYDKLGAIAGAGSILRGEGYNAALDAMMFAKNRQYPVTLQRTPASGAGLVGGGAVTTTGAQSQVNTPNGTIIINNQIGGNSGVRSFSELKVTGKPDLSAEQPPDAATDPGNAAKTADQIRLFPSKRRGGLLHKFEVKDFYNK